MIENMLPSSQIFSISSFVMAATQGSGRMFPSHNSGFPGDQEPVFLLSAQSKY